MLVPRSFWDALIIKKAIHLGDCCFDVFELFLLLFFFYLFFLLTLCHFLRHKLLDIDGFGWLGDLSPDATSYGGIIGEFNNHVIGVHGIFRAVNWLLDWLDDLVILLKHVFTVLNRWQLSNFGCVLRSYLLWANLASLLVHVHLVIANHFHLLLRHFIIGRQCKQWLFDKLFKLKSFYGICVCGVHFIWIFNYFDIINQIRDKLLNMRKIIHQNDRYRLLQWRDEFD